MAEPAPAEPLGFHVDPRQPAVGRVRCDGFGCPETHPVNHEFDDQPGFTHGRWLGWVYLDINDARLSMRPMRFCSFWCLKAWLGDIEYAQRERNRSGRDDSLSLDEMHNEVASPRQVRAVRAADSPRPPRPTKLTTRTARGET